MKKYLYYFLAFFLLACNEESIVEESTNTNSSNGVSTVWISNGKVYRNMTRATEVEDNNGVTTALCFENEEALKSFIERLDYLSYEEKVDLVHQYDVKSVHDVASYADDELEAIADSASTEEEFRELYDAYVQKYSGFLLTNYTDESDLTLYAKDADNPESYIANEDGVYVVDDVITYANLKDALSESVIQMSTSTSPLTRVGIYKNQAEKKLDGKKVFIRAYRNHERLGIQMYCKKKLWYGWKNDPHRKYYFETHLNREFIYAIVGPYGQMCPKPRLARYKFEEKVKRGISYIIGYQDSGKITGSVSAWVDLTTEHDSKGNQIYETINNGEMPKCLSSKAMIMEVEL